jgi:hypothetical protein
MKRLMIAGFGDVARRALPRLEDRFEVLRIARRYGSDLRCARSPTMRWPASTTLLTTRK